MFLTFPMLNLATVGLRSTFFLCASREAAHIAAHSKTFQNSISSSEPSAQVAAQNTAQTIQNGFSGISLSSVQTSIVAVNINTQQVTDYTAPLSSPPDTNTNVYNIKVKVTGTVKPLIQYNGTLFGSVPGLTAPMSLSAQSQEFCENPQGLTQ